MEMQKSNIESLRSKVSQDKVAQDVMHVLSFRQKGRHCLTLHALNFRMHREGFTHPAERYRNVLKMIADAGFAKADLDKKGRIKGLKEIKYTLASLGKAVLQQEDKIKSYTQRNRFKDLVNMAEMIKTPPVLAKVVELKPFHVSDSVSITLSINDKPVVIPLPTNFTTDEIAGLINRLHEKKAR